MVNFNRLINRKNTFRNDTNRALYYYLELYISDESDELHDLGLESYFPTTRGLGPEGEGATVQSGGARDGGGRRVVGGRRPGRRARPHLWRRGGGQGGVGRHSHRNCHVLRFLVAHVGVGALGGSSTCVHMLDNKTRSTI